MTDYIDATSPVTITVQQLPSGGFVGSVGYNPGQTVTPGTTVTLTYTVRNNGGPGTLFGGLYDNAAPNPNLIAGYWEESFTAGQEKTKTVSVLINVTFAGQLCAGHVE
jgi:hypothetical protein